MTPACQELGFLPDKPLLSDFPIFTANPFIEPIISLKVKKKTISISSSSNMVINESGQYIGDSHVMVSKKVDKEEFVKIFKNQLALIFDLTKTAQKVMTYFIKNLGINKDIVIFDIERARIESGLNSKVSIYKGLAELVERRIIARSNLSQVYFINPSVLFNGDRLVVVNEWLRDDKLGPSALENAEDWKEDQEPLQLPA